MRRFLPFLVLIGSFASATADITIYTIGSPKLAADAVAALNARASHEKYVLAGSEPPGRFPLRRVIRPFNVSKVPKDYPLFRTKAALVVDRDGEVVDVAAFDFNQPDFAAVIVKKVPEMVKFTESKIRKPERILIVYEFNIHDDLPKDLTTPTSLPANGVGTQSNADLKQK